MPAVVQKSTNATNNIVCLNQSTSVGEDGFITVRARFLLRSTADLQSFTLDYEWPSGSTPRGLPNHQGGPYLVSRDFEYSNGLIFVSAVYATAANPVRVVYSTNRATRAFSGLIAIVEGGTATTVSAKFDYTSQVASAKYAIVDDAAFTPRLEGVAKIVSITGVASSLLAKIAKKNIYAEDRTKTGRITQVSRSLEVVFYSNQ